MGAGVSSKQVMVRAAEVGASLTAVTLRVEVSALELVVPSLTT